MITLLLFVDFWLLSVVVRSVYVTLLILVALKVNIYYCNLCEGGSEGNPPLCGEPNKPHLDSLSYTQPQSCWTVGLIVSIFFSPVIRSPVSCRHRVFSHLLKEWIGLDCVWLVLSFVVCAVTSHYEFTAVCAALVRLTLQHTSSDGDLCGSFMISVCGCSKQTWMLLLAGDCSYIWFCGFRLSRSRLNGTK